MAIMPLYVSCAATREIACYGLDGESGALEPRGMVEVPGRLDGPPTSMPLAVSPDHRFLYAVLRSPPYPVASFAIAPGSGALSLLGTGELPDAMAYLVTDRSGRHLLAASYTGACLTSNPIDAAGRAQTAGGQIVPTAPRAHSILVDPGNRFAYAAVLGGDHVMQLRFDAATGRLRPNDPPEIATAPGAGPRHLAFHPDGRFLYCLNELDGTVDTFAFDRESGRLSPLQTVAATPDGRRPAASAEAADLHLTPDGRFLYGSLRATNTLAAFRVDPAQGTLTPLGSFPTEASPRGFAIEPRGRFLVAAGQLSDHLAVYAIDAATGGLTPIRRYPTGGNPNWIEILPAA